MFGNQQDDNAQKPGHQSRTVVRRFATFQKDECGKNLTPDDDFKNLGRNAREHSVTSFVCGVQIFGQKRLEGWAGWLQCCMEGKGSHTHVFCELIERTLTWRATRVPIPWKKPLGQIQLQSAEQIVDPDKSQQKFKITSEDGITYIFCCMPRARHTEKIMWLHRLYCAVASEELKGTLEVPSILGDEAMAKVRKKKEELAAAEASRVIVRGVDEEEDEVDVMPLPCCGKAHAALSTFVTSKPFDNFILLAIIANSVVSGFADYSNIDPATGELKTEGSERNTLIFALDPFFLVIFTTEMLLKMSVFGLTNKKSWYSTDPHAHPGYFRDGWNWLDFVVVITGWLELVGPSEINLSFMRFFRTLRPLRTMKGSPKMRQLVNTLIASIPKLCNVVMFLGMVFTLWGIFALQLWGWQGQMHGRCRLTPYPLSMDALNGSVFDVHNRTNARSFPPDDPPVHDPAFTAALMAGHAGSGSAVRCVQDANDDKKWSDMGGKVDSPWHGGQDCVWPIAAEHPKYCDLGRATEGWGSAEKGGRAGGVLSGAGCPQRFDGTKMWCGSNFDNAGNSRFKSAEVMRSDTYVAELNWGYTNYDTMGDSVFTVILGITLKWVEAMYSCMNGFDPLLAVVFFVFLVFFGAFFVMNVLLAVIWQSFEETTRNALEIHATELAEEMFRKCDVNHDGTVDFEELQAMEVFAFCSRKELISAIDGAGVASMRERSKQRRRPTSVKDGVNGADSEGNERDRGAAGGTPTPSSPYSAAHPQAAVLANFTPSELKMILQQPVLRSQLRLAAKAAEAEARTGHVSLLRRCCRLCTVFKSKQSQAFVNIKVDAVRKLVSSKYFVAAIFVVILLNTLTLACDRWPMEQWEKDTIESLNFGFGLIFVVEMLLKMLGIGLKGYCSDAFNRFDALLVTIFVLDLCLNGAPVIAGAADSSVAESKGGGTFTAMRIFRLLRAVKLLHNAPALRRLVEIIIRMVIETSNFGLLLLLCLYIFSLLGMQLFANRFRFDPISGTAISPLEYYERTSPPLDADHLPLGTVPRANFDTLFAAFMTVFQLLTGDDWETVMFDGMRGTSPTTGRTYFLTFTVVGNLVMLNLFLAMLIGSFNQVSNDEDEEASMEFTTTEANKLHIYRDGKCYEMALPGGADLQKLLRWKPLIQAMLHVTDKLDDDELETVQTANFKLFTFPRQRELRRGNLEILGYQNSQLALILAGPSQDRREDPWRELPQWANLELENKDWMVLQYDACGQTTLEDLQDHTPKKQPANALNAGSMFAAADKTGARSNFSGGDEREGESRASEGMDVALAITQGEEDTDGLGRDSQRGGLAGVYADVPCVKIVGRFVHLPAFDNTIMILVVVSSLLMATDDPLSDPSGAWPTVLMVCNWIFTIIFTVEMVLKLIAWGGLTYITNPWNTLDFCIVCISWAGLCGGEAGGMRALRTLRTLRPLRAISRNPGLKVVVLALFRSMPAVVNVLAICLFFFLMFAIVGVNYLKGAFYSCQGDGWESLTDAQQHLVTYPVQYAQLNATSQKLFNVTGLLPPLDMLSLKQKIDVFGYEARGSSPAQSREVCLWLGCAWGPLLQTDVNYDNVFNALMLLFECSTCEGWIYLLYATIDARGVNMQPIFDYNRNWFYFYFLFILFCSFFMLNLFVGVVVDNFNAMKRQSADGLSILLTEQQKRWVRLQQMMQDSDIGGAGGSQGPKRPSGGAIGCVRGVCFDLSYTETGPKAWLTFVFNMGIIFAILLNTFILATRYLGMTDAHQLWIESINGVCTWIFLVEAIIKITAVGFRFYLQDNWNCFDFFIVVFSMAGVCAQHIGQSFNTGFLTLLRMLRALRAVRIVRFLTGVRTLFNTMVLSLPSLANISALLFLMYFMYAVMGVQLFAKVALGESMNEDANFQTFAMAMLVLIRCSTGEGWNSIMHDAAAQRPGCSSDPPSDPLDSTIEPHLRGLPWCTGPLQRFDAAEGTCRPLNGCGNSLAYGYFMSFTVLITFVFVNLFVAVILEQFEQSSEIEDGNSTVDRKDAVGLTASEYCSFCGVWQEEDTQLAWTLPEDRLWKVLCKLYKPMGLGRKIELTDTECISKVLGEEFKLDPEPCEVGEVGEVGWYLFESVVKAVATRVIKHEMKMDQQQDEAAEKKPERVVINRTTNQYAREDFRDDGFSDTTERGKALLAVRMLEFKEGEGKREKQVEADPALKIENAGGADIDWNLQMQRMSIRGGVVVTARKERVVV
jgi:hypothetical protein